jgi:hypothetical protein
MSVRLAWVGLLAVMSLAIAFGAFQPGDRTYSLPAFRISQHLDEMDLPDAIFGDQALIARHWRESASTFIWVLQTSEDIESLRLSVTINETDQGTRLSFETLPPKGKGSEPAARGLKNNPAVRDLYRSALMEQVDAKLRDRDFALLNIWRPMTRVALVAIPYIPLAMARRDPEGPSLEQRNIDAAYANERR